MRNGKPTKWERTLVERFMAKIRVDGECWIWTGTTTKAGYGQLKAWGCRVYAHRFSYELHIGPIPDGLGLLHSCDTPACVRPDHLTPGTQTENMQDASRKGRLPRTRRGWTDEARANHMEALRRAA